MNILKFYNNNRFTIWVAIIAIVVFLLILRLLNAAVVEQNKKENVTTITNEKLYENKTDIKEQISEEKIKENSNLVIDQFIKYCNAKDLVNAYNLITDECKEIFFKTIDEFEQKYINANFNTEKLYSKEIEYGKTYKVSLYENMLTTGLVNDNAKIGYYTIVQNDGKTQLNICGFIGKKEINKTYKNDKIKIDILSKDIYQEYEIYNINFVNLTNDTIILDTKNSTKTMYLVGDDKLNYYSASHEILSQSLTIKPNALNSTRIKYIKQYNKIKDEKIVFEDVIFGYKENTDKNSYKKDSIVIGI